jgi:MerR family transcriptional regulator/heat shock protein HspR
MRYEEEIRFHKQEEGVYTISVAARILKTHPQTLRLYEKEGLIRPKRARESEHSPRLYSQSDIETIRRIQHLTQEMGVNLAGVEVIFKLLSEVDRLHREMEAEMQRLHHLYSQMLAQREAETHPSGNHQRLRERPDAVRIVPIEEVEEKRET